MSDVQSRERSPETVSGAQREPDERVRELQRRLDGYMAASARLGHKPPPELLALLKDAIAALRQAAQREPVAEVMATGVMGGVCDPYGVPAAVHWFNGVPPVGTKLYTQAQRDDHPGLLREARAMLNDWLYGDEGAFTMQQHIDFLAKLDAALAASKGAPDSMGQGQPLPSLSVDTSVADRKDAARYRWLRDIHGPVAPEFQNVMGGRSNRLPHIAQFPHQPSIDLVKIPQVFEGVKYRPDNLDAAIDAAMSADVRSQAQDTQRQGDDQRREHDEHKGETR